MAAALTAVVVPVTAGPAAADPAPLVTEDGIGIRLDETALTGPALAEIETALQPFVDQMIYDGATDDDAPFQSHLWVEATSDLNLSLDVLSPDGTRPSGGLAVHADITAIEIEWRMNGFWGTGQCSIWANPDTGTVDITAAVDKNRLPLTPIELDGISATWDDDPAIDYDWNCAGHIWLQGFLNWWDNAWDPTDPESTASKIETMLNDTAQGMIDDLWAEHVAPVLDSLASFGVTVNQLHTDDHGLIVTANTDATGGLTIPGLGGPFDVSGAEDSGADSDVNALLANRTNDAGDSHVIVSVHPNVANQFMDALDQFLSDYGQPLVSADIEDVLLDPAVHGNYADGGWTVLFEAQAAPYTEPTGADGAPQLEMPDVTLTFFSSSYQFGFFPVATLEGAMGSIDLITEVRSESGDWGPGFSTANAATSLTLVQANPDVQAFAPDPADILPFAKTAFDSFNDGIFVAFLSLAPIQIGNLTVDLCPIATCGRYDDDERYTETFLIS